MATENNNQSGIYIVDEQLKEHSTIESFIKEYNENLYVEYVIDVNTSDISIDKENGYIKVGSDKYACTQESATKLCKILKIPFTFTKKISLILFDINVEELKHINKDIQLIIIPSDNKDKYKGIISNINVGNIYYPENYHNELFSLFENKDIMNDKKIQFHFAISSRNGFHIYYSNNNSKDIFVEDNKYKFGQCFIGDIYKINKHLLHSVFVYNELNNNILFFDEDSPQTIRYLMLSKKEFPEDYQTNLINNIMEDIGIYNESVLFDKYIQYSINHNVSYAMLEYALKASKRLFDSTEFIYEIFGFRDKEHILSIREKVDEIKATTAKFDVVKELCIKGVQDMNAHLLINNLLFTKQHMTTLGELILLNNVCNQVLKETFECKVN